MLVTGGSGQLGSYLLDDLSKTHEVLGVDLRRPRFSRHEGLVRTLDIRDLEVLKRECKGVDAVIHTAAQVSVQKSTEDPRMDADFNILGTISALQAAYAAGVQKFIYISSAAIYGDPVYVPVDENHPRSPKSFYGTSKLAGEYYTKAFHASFGLPYVVVRPFNFYSPRADPKSPYSGVITKFAEWARRGEPLLIEGDGEQTRDFIHAADVAYLLRLVIQSNVVNQTFNCGSGRSTSVNQLAESVVKVAPLKVEIKHIPPRIGDIRNSVSSIKLAKEALGFQPRISLEDGLRTFFEK